ncbi:hypothetical protein LCGC14_0614010 [marine sediment metagenome]|uniref:Uncharacterized protein n=1 Tax=marine sediment metagenome TaxID=412755 RepID=A0A0F9TT82_9ZZZZ
MIERIIHDDDVGRHADIPRLLKFDGFDFWIPDHLHLWESPAVEMQDIKSLADLDMDM